MGDWDGDGAGGEKGGVDAVEGRGCTVRVCVMVMLVIVQVEGDWGSRWKCSPGQAVFVGKNWVFEL
jgi:hypothetical protein